VRSNSKELRHDRHTVSLFTDHMVYSLKYRGKVLVGDVVEKYISAHNKYEHNGR